MASKYPLEEDEENDQANYPHRGCLSGLGENDEFIPENEVVPEGFDGLQDKFADCENYPNHVDFYRPSEISIDTLPEELKSEENLHLIRKKIDLTVRIVVRYTSKKRPDTFSDQDLPYPYANIRGQRNPVRTGTGMINRVLSSEAIKQSCPCRKCVKSNNPVKEHYRFTVRTATHVVFNDSEAETATFDCFYDLDDLRSVRALYGFCVDGTYTSYSDMNRSDVCDVVVVTHDKDTADRIIDLVSSTKLPVGVPHLYTYALPPEGVIVSHPHGCSKRVTFGNVLHVTVPVEPKYKTGKAMPLSNPTRCRFNVERLNASEEVKETSTCVQDYSRMLEFIIEMTENDGTRPLNWLHGVVDYASSARSGTVGPNSARSHPRGESSVSPSMQISTSEKAETSSTPDNSASNNSQGRDSIDQETRDDASSRKFDKEARSFQENSQSHGCGGSSISSGRSLLEEASHTPGGHSKDIDLQGLGKSSSVGQAKQVVESSGTSNLEAPGTVGNSANSCSQRQDTSASQTGSKNSSEASLVASCHEFCDAVFEAQSPSEFGHVYHDPSRLLDFTNSIRGKKNSDLSSGLFQMINASLPSSQSEFQSSREYHEGDSITDANLDARKAAFTDFVTTTTQWMGIEKEMVDGVMRLMKTMMPALLGESHDSIDQDQNTLENLFAGVFQLTNSFSGTDLNGASNAAGDNSGNSRADTNNENQTTAGGVSEADDSVVGVAAVDERGGYNGEDKDNENSNDSGGADPNPTTTTREPELDDDANVDNRETKTNEDIEGDQNDPDTVVQNNTTLEEDTAAGAHNKHPESDKSAASKAEVRRGVVTGLQNNLQTALGECDSNNRNILLDVFPIANEGVEIFCESFRPSLSDSRTENGLTLPFAMNFILPSNAPYAMRYSKGSPGWYSFPEGTKLSTSDGRSVHIAAGTEFHSAIFAPQFSKVIHDIPTCKGSSGATIYSGLVGNQSLTFYPHLGSGTYDKKPAKLSGTQENKMAGKSAATWESMQRAGMKYTTSMVKQGLKKAGIVLPQDLELD